VRILAEMRDRARKSHQLDLGKVRKEGIEEGRAKGIEEGRAKGVEEGRAKGIEEGVRRSRRC
jgi:flagellar biosynthesis/type III secretory pathway protein FliH